MTRRTVSIDSAGRTPNAPRIGNPRTPWHGSESAWPQHPAQVRRSEKQRLVLVALDPALQLRSALKTGDHRVARLRPCVLHSVPQPFCVNDEQRPPRKGDPALCRGVVSVFTDNHVTVRVISQVQPGTDYPA